jgi:hypothetical protein
MRLRKCKQHRRAGRGEGGEKEDQDRRMNTLFALFNVVTRQSTGRRLCDLDEAKKLEEEQGGYRGSANIAVLIR